MTARTLAADAADAVDGRGVPVAAVLRWAVMTGRELGNRVRELREARGLSAIQLADRARVAHSYIAVIEAGQQRLPPRGILVRLAKALGVTEKRLQDPAA